jgi:hypothetical protein
MPAKSNTPASLWEGLREEIERRRTSPRYREFLMLAEGAKASTTKLQKLAEQLHRGKPPFAWLRPTTAQPPKQLNRTKRGPYRKPQGDRIDAKLKQIFPPDGKPPATVANSDIVEAVTDTFEKDRKSGALAVPHRRSILRRAGRAK